MRYVRSLSLFGGTIVLATIAGLATPSLATTIAGLESQSVGTTATVGNTNPLVITGIGSVPGLSDGYPHGSYLFFAQDSTGSAEFFGTLPTGSTYVPTVGDAITASGTFAVYQSAPELDALTAISLLSSNNAVPAPEVVSAAGLQVTPTYAVLGHILSLQNVEFTTPGVQIPAASATNYTVTDLAGLNPVDVYQNDGYSASGALAGTIIPSGPVDLTGFVQIYTPPSGPAITQFIPLSITSVPEPTTVGILVIAAMPLLRRTRRGRSDRHR